MRSLLVIVLAAATSYHFCDVRSGKAVQAVLMPLVFFLCIMAFVLWVHARTRLRSRSRGDTSGGVSVPFGSGSGFGSSGD
jgi:hypothetical protein